MYCVDLVIDCFSALLWPLGRCNCALSCARVTVFFLLPSLPILLFFLIHVFYISVYLVNLQQPLQCPAYSMFIYEYFLNGKMQIE